MNMFADSQLEPEYNEPFTKWKATPGPATNSAMLKSLKPVMDSAVRNYGGAQASPALHGQAKLITLKSFGSYDPAKGPLQQHVYSHLRRLQRVGAQQSQIIQLPERVSMDRMHLQETETNLADELGRDASDLEIADRTGLSLKRIKHIRQAQAPINSGRVQREDSEGNSFDPASTIPGQHDAEDAWRTFVYHDLGPVDQVVMDHALGMNGKPRLPPGEVARRLGITPSAVSQRAAKIQAMLDERLSNGGLF